MSDAQFIQILLGIVGSLIGVVGLWIGKSIERMAESVETLNTNMAVVIEKVNSHEKRIERLEEKEQ